MGADAAIARVINVPLEEFKEAVRALNSPDAKSGSKEYEGRRIVPIEHAPGYHIVNYVKYSGIKNDSERRDYFRIKKQESRQRRVSQRVPPCPSENVRDCPQAEAEAEAEAEAVQRERERERGANARLHGLPATVEEVIEAGRRSIPKAIPEATCRAFWSHYESQAKTNENGQVYWVTGGDSPSVITNWREKLKTWRADAKKPAAGQSRYHVPNI